MEPRFVAPKNPRKEKVGKERKKRKKEVLKDRGQNKHKYRLNGH